MRGCTAGVSNIIQNHIIDHNKPIPPANKFNDSFSKIVLNNFQTGNDKKKKQNK